MVNKTYIAVLTPLIINTTAASDQLSEQYNLQLKPTEAPTACQLNWPKAIPEFSLAGSLRQSFMQCVVPNLKGAYTLVNDIGVFRGSVGTLGGSEQPNNRGRDGENDARAIVDFDDADTVIVIRHLMHPIKWMCSECQVRRYRLCNWG